MRRFFPSLALYLALAGTAPAHAESVGEKAADDGTISVPAGDPQMEAAFAEARRTWPQFLAAFEAGDGKAKNFSVKLKVVDGTQVEYFWTMNLRRAGEGFEAEINNEPESVKTVKFGQTMHFKPDEIYDWMYFAGGKMIGNVTLCVLLTREPADEAESFKKSYGLACR